MDLNKQKEFFDPEKFKTRINIVGCGALGGRVALTLARMGLKEIHLWDEDLVAPHNICNQVYLQKHIGKKKTDCLEEMMHQINPDIKVTKHGFCAPKDNITDIVMVCLDNIDIRRALFESWKTNPYIEWVCDGRMALTAGNVNAADWQSKKQIETLLKSCNFTHEEAVAATPVSACGFTLSVVYCPEIVASMMVANFVAWTKEEARFYINIDIKECLMEGYKWIDI